MVTIVLDLLAISCALAMVFYIRAARHRQRVLRLIESDVRVHPEAVALAYTSVRKEVHGAVVYGLLAAVALLVGRVDVANITVVLGLLGVPAVASIWWARTAVEEARMARNRYALERRAEQALQQEQLAPKAWAARLAPEEVPDFSGFEIGRVYQAGSGLMAGDFFDVNRVGRHRVAAVIGDVSGHGIESSITAW